MPASQPSAQHPAAFYPQQQQQQQYFNNAPQMAPPVQHQQQQQQQQIQPQQPIQAFNPSLQPRAQTYPAQPMMQQQQQQQQQYQQPQQQQQQQQLAQPPTPEKPKAPIPAEHQVIQMIFDALLSKCLSLNSLPINKRKLDDVAKKLETLYDKLRENSVSSIQRPFCLKTCGFFLDNLILF